MIGPNETSKANHLAKVCEDAYKSPINVVIVDNTERILEFVTIGPQFSNAVLQTFVNLFCKQPPWPITPYYRNDFSMVDFSTDEFAELPRRRHTGTKCLEP